MSGTTVPANVPYATLRAPTTKWHGTLKHNEGWCKKYIDLLINKYMRSSRKTFGNNDMRCDMFLIASF